MTIRRIAFAAALAAVASLASAADSAKLDCARVVPAAVVAKWVPGGKVTGRFAPPGRMECKLEGKGMPLIAAYTCSITYTPDYWARYKAEMAKQGAKEIADVPVGKGGVYSLAWGLPSISFVDGDTNCLVTVTPMGLDKAKAIAFAGDLEKALTVESAK